MELDTGFAAGMTVYLSVCITESAELSAPGFDKLAVPNLMDSSAK
jgi:hypothetical protein